MSLGDIERFRAGATESPPLPCPPAPKRGGRGYGSPFVRGPLPLAWLAAAKKAGSSALAVGLALWFQRGVRPNSLPVKVTRSVARQMDLSQDQTRRGLAALQSAGLVTIVQGGRGRCPVVEIVENAPQGAHESTEATKEANL
jgi:hypothetical protein